MEIDDREVKPLEDQQQHHRKIILEKSLACLGKKDYQGAVAFINHLLTSKDISLDESHRLTFHRGQVLSAMGDRTGALVDFETVAFHANAAVERVRTLIEMERYEDAVEARFEAMRAGVLTAGGGVEEFKADTMKVLLGEVQDRKMVGNKMFALKEFNDAISLYSKAIRVVQAFDGRANGESLCLNRDVAILFANRAACYQALSFMDLAAEDAIKATSRDPSYEKAWNRLFQCVDGNSSVFACKRAERLSFLAKCNEWEKYTALAGEEESKAAMLLFASLSNKSHSILVSENAIAN